MQISDFLSPADVQIDSRVSSKRELLKQSARSAAERLALNPDQISAELFKREELGSTGTGEGIAIPHARIAGVEKPFGLAVRLRYPIDFDSIDGQPVDLVFVLLLPTANDREHLGALAAVARKLRTPEAVTDLRRAKDVDQFYSRITL
jgi:PTS system nitrogen regulatory IIA component